MYNYTFFASKQTFARIDFLRQVGDWWTKKALRMLNFLLKIRQKTIVTYTHAGAAEWETRTLTSAKASGCRACKTISYNSLLGVRQ